MLQKVPSKQLWTFVSSAGSIRSADLRSAYRGLHSKLLRATPAAGRAMPKTGSLNLGRLSTQTWEDTLEMCPTAAVSWDELLGSNYSRAAASNTVWSGAEMAGKLEAENRVAPLGACGLCDKCCTYTRTHPTTHTYIHTRVHTPHVYTRTSHHTHPYVHTPAPHTQRKP